uniref:LanC-like protein GCL2 n=1 Tax=Rhizophora mucronata TaxID=61149 RepID=A0A2P2KQN9_RHIMU
MVEFCDIHQMFVGMSQIVAATWRLNRKSVQDFTLYSGTLGTAFLLFKSFQITNNKNDLFLCLEIAKACDAASVASRDVTFICGRAGVCALGAAAASYANDEALRNYYLKQFAAVQLSRNHSDELLYGRSGFLWACFFLNKHLGEGTIPNATIRAVAKEIIKNGRTMGKKVGSPLMYEWYGKKYQGAALGLAGIMHVLMDVNLKPDELNNVKGTLKYMIRNRFPSGNYPASEEDRRRDVLVHWCQGAPGIALTLVKAAKVFGDEEFLQSAIGAAEVLWNRGLLKRVGICHGVSGNTYVFLSLYQLTGNLKFLYRAKAFACFLLDRAHKLIAAGEMHGGDSPYSLFEGIGGMAYLFLDMANPSNARFPAYEL